MALWHGGTFHLNRANISDQIRHGLNVAYYPPWFNRFVREGYEPVAATTLEEMPEALRRMCRRYLK